MNEYTKEQNRIRSAKFYQENKEAILLGRKAKVVCECGKLVTKASIVRHKKSKFHIANPTRHAEYLRNLEEEKAQQLIHGDNWQHKCWLLKVANTPIFSGCIGEDVD